jgi:copper chaperone CopZ
MSNLQLSVPGMTCQHCVRTVSAALSDVANVTAVHVDLETKLVTVSGGTDEAAVRAAVAEAGYAIA